MMAGDPAFVASAFGRTGITPTIGLGIPLYVIHSTFVGPLTNADTELPAHHWVLCETVNGSIISISAPSNASGVCAISDVVDPGPGPFALGFVPAPTDARTFLIDNNEAWVDLDAKPLAWATPQPDRTQIERRNLFRIPAWTTRRKALRGGGFKVWPDKARPATRDTGILEREDLLRKPFGSIAAPWEIAIDFNWVHATVRYFFFDWGRDKQGALPPGLFVEAVPAQPDSMITRVGAGTAIKDGDGSARMLIEVDLSKWSGIQFQFSAPAESRVDLAAPEPAAGAKDTRLTAAGAAPADRNVRNLLPIVWHSLGQRCKASAGGTSYGNEWTAITTKLIADAQRDVTAEFHLDDVQLTNNDGSIHDDDSGRPALFDHFMKLIDAVTKRPHQSDTTVDRGFLIADKAFTIGKGALAAGQKRLERSTRLVHLEGHFFDLREDRVTGVVGKKVMVGARAAVQNAHLFVSYGGSRGANPFLEKQGFYEIHLIDVPGVQDVVAAASPLMHMLVYASCKIDEGGMAPSVVDDFYALFTEASERWSQGSPGVPTSSKDYRIVSRDPAKRDKIIRPRMFFGQVTRGEIMSLALEHGAERPNTGELTWWLRFLVTPSMKYFEGSISMDKGRSGGSAADSDGFSAAWHTLAHEFGHVLGLPDEYGEELSPSDIDPAQRVTNPRVLGYPSLAANEGMPTDYRPFYGDLFSQMNQNALPRLRHYWHHVEALNRDGAFATGKGIPGAPFVIRHETLGGGIENVRSIDEHKHPYAALFAGKPIPGGHGDCALFPVGQDEGVTEAIFAPPSVLTPPPPASPLLPADRFDGFLIVRSRVRFRFASSVIPADRWTTIWPNFIRQLYDTTQRERVRFALTGGSQLSRIAIFVQPHCAEGISLSPDDFKLVLSTTSTPGANPFAGTVGSTVDLDTTQFNAFCVLRAILGVPTRAPAPPSPPVPAFLPNTAPLAAADFVNIAKLADAELGDPPGTRSVVAL